jgi:2-oxoglutarate ferredoxin oxidoreductase subunit alpha
MAMYGRHGESPLPIVAAPTPAACFDHALEAARIAIKYRTPVILLTDTFLANSSEPWLIPSADQLPEIEPNLANGPNTADGDFMPYLRDENLARPWAVPGVPGLMHRIGGLEKEDGSGNISSEAENHARMTELRAGKVAGIDVPALEIDDQARAELLVVGWGSTYGAIKAAVSRARAAGCRVARAHLTHLNPLPANTGDILRRYERILVPELNSGQLTKLLRAEFLVDARSYSKVEGVPFSIDEVEAEIVRAGAR